MARKTWMYAVLEAVQYEMRQDKNMIWIFELTPPVASNPGKPVINLEKEFGRKRVVNTGIDETWMAGCTLGAGLAGSKAVTYIPYQGNCMSLPDDPEPRRQAAPHDRRPSRDAGRVHPGDDRPDAGLCRAALRLRDRHLLRSHPGREDRDPVDARRRQGHDGFGDSRPQPSRLSLSRRPARTGRGSPRRAVHGAARQGGRAHDAATISPSSAPVPACPRCSQPPISCRRQA